MHHHRHHWVAVVWSSAVGLGALAIGGCPALAQSPTAEAPIAPTAESIARTTSPTIPNEAATPVEPRADSTANPTATDPTADQAANPTSNPASDLPEEEPNRAFRQTGCFGDEPIATDKEIRQQGLTPPSLWLTRDLLGGKIVNRWTIHTGNDERPPWVEVTFNLQPWNNLEYPRQYAYLNEFGRVAREYGYNVRVCNSRGDTLAAQFCTWDQMRGWSTCPIYLPGGFSARVRSPLF